MSAVESLCFWWFSVCFCDYSFFVKILHRWCCAVVFVHTRNGGAWLFCCRRLQRCASSRTSWRTKTDGNKKERTIKRCRDRERVRQKRATRSEEQRQTRREVNREATRRRKLKETKPKQLARVEALRKQTEGKERMETPQAEMLDGLKIVKQRKTV